MLELIVFISPFSEPGASTRRLIYLAQAFEDYRLIMPGQDKYGVSTRSERHYLPLGRKSFLLLPVWWVKSLMALLKWKPSVVVFLKPHLFTLPTALAYRILTGRPIVFDCDEWDPATLADNDEPGWKVSLTEFLAGVSLKVSALIMYGNHLTLEEKIPVGFRGKTVYVPNGVDTSFFNRPAEPHKGFRIVFSGMLFKIKHIIPVVQAVDDVKDDVSGIKCVIVGGGSRLDELKAIVEEKGLSEHFEFKGMVDHSQLPDIFSTADVLIAPFTDLPGIRYQSNVKVFEYMSSGRPIIASRVGELDVVLDDGDLGFLTAPGDSAAISEAVRGIHAGMEAAREMGLRSREKAVREYDWKVLGKRLKERINALK
ncbi:MAG: glycosyltransferase [Candidatus Altiarchaeota archaeon]